MPKKIILAIISVFCVLSLCSCTKNEKVTKTEFCLDTLVTITSYGENAEAATDAAIDEIKRTESVFSPFLEGSELYKINQNAHLGYEISDEMKKVLKEALRVCELTGGAFDITLKPLSDLWNIKSENPVVPPKEKIEEAKSKVGYENVEISGNVITFKKEGIALDLGGAIKGYAADRAAEILKSYGIKNAILDLGGNIYALGKSEKGKAWRIGLQDPSKERGEFFKAIELSNSSCVTSGSYERYFENNGKIYHHIIDRSTGYSADAGLISVSVIGKSSFEADMLSTAIFVMGEEKFEKIRDNFSIEKYVTVDKNNHFKER